MILSVSRRTDIPAYYADWFLNRLKEGEVLVRNPLNRGVVSRISLAHAVVDGIVFWSKNPQPLLAHLPALAAYPYYVQYTLNGYGREVEMALPPCSERVETFQTLARCIGSERVIWRYDPVVMGQRYTVAYHIHQFGRLAKDLQGYTELCIFSFVDIYPSIAARLAAKGLRTATPTERQEIVGAFAQIATQHGFRLAACAESTDFAAYGVAKAQCIDSNLLACLSGTPLSVVKDPHQRAACGCAAAIDIGAYNSCPNGCIYCYANHNQTLVAETTRLYAPLSPLLCSHLHPTDVVRDKAVASHAQTQISLFDGY